MKKQSQSLRFKLFFWYLLSLILLGFFIILTVHIYQYKYSIYVLATLFLVLSMVGFVTIHKFTRSLHNLSSQIRQISSRNLDKRITAITGDGEIDELAATFNDLLSRLDTAFKQERQFIADVAHEMKTPIATLQSSFEVTLHKERTNEEYRKIIKDSIIETERITNTLKDILDLAWSEVPNKNKKDEFSLSALMEELGEIAQKLASRKKVEVVQSITQHIIICGFKDRLGRAIINIIDNAIKYTPAGGKVQVGLEKEKDWAIISVRDTGQGIKQSELGHIFDRFYRGEKTDKIFGAGLGLAIAKATVSAHQGTIEVKSRLKQGSLFVISVPLGNLSS